MAENEVFFSPRETPAVPSPHPALVHCGQAAAHLPPVPLFRAQKAGALVQTQQQRAAEQAIATRGCAAAETAVLTRFSTGGATIGSDTPEVRVGWFKSPLESVSMEQLNHSHDCERFSVLPLASAEAWRECHVHFLPGSFCGNSQVIISNMASRSRGSVALFFPGFRAVGMKLLFRCPGTMCSTRLLHHGGAAAPDCDAVQVAVDTSPNTLPIGFALHLRSRDESELTASERSARQFFNSALFASVALPNDEAAARLDAFVEGMSVGETRQPGMVLPALFDSRPGSQVVSVRMCGVARSASAPRFVEVSQCPAGQPAHSKQVLLKRGDNPHQDRFALAMARVFNHLWQLENASVSVAGRLELVQNVVYDVLQAGVRTSVIEVVMGSQPVKSFHDRHSKVMLAMFGDSWWQGDLNDWVPSGPLLASAAAAFTTAYVLDVGDRHQDNMLVTRDGRLFNIDYGYLFGEHPRLVDARPFAIPVAFRTALVQNGFLWGTFKAACVRAFAILAKHRDFVVLQALEVARALGSHRFATCALTFGSRLAGEGILPEGTLQLPPEAPIDAYVAALGPELSRRIEQGVYGHQAKDALHERACAIM